MKAFQHPSEPVSMTAVERLDDATALEWLELWTRGAFAPPSSRESGPGRIAAPSLTPAHALYKGDSSRVSTRLVRALTGRSSRPRRSFEIGRALETARVSASRPLALLERRLFGVVISSCFIFEPIEGVTLRDYLLEPRKAPERHELWAAIAVEVARLHSASVRQRDLKAPNVIVREKPAGSLASGLPISVGLIDLEGMRLLRSPPSLRIRARDLARLAASLLAAEVSPEDWSFLLERYLETGIVAALPGSAQVDWLHAWTLRWAREKLLRNERNRRPTW